jgi:hypothetical protein
VAGALPYEESGATRDLDGGLHIVLVVGLLLIHAIWEMPLTVLVDREGRIAISHAGVVDPLVFEADINALLAK